MAHFHIARIAISPHQAMYDELIAAFSASLTELGHVCTSSVNEVAGGAVNLLLGTAICATRQLRLRRRLQGIPYIVYQLEQLDDRFGMLPDWPDYVDLLAEAAAIWDYAPSSTAYLRNRGLSVSEVPLSYHPGLENFRPCVTPDLDVLLVGSPNPRRLHILDALDKAGVKVGLVKELYGPRRDALIARARILLNIHGWDDLAKLETIRLSHLLANRCFVISETADHDPYDGGIVYADYPDLVSACLTWLERTAADREALVERGYRALRRTSMTDVLRHAVAALGDLARLSSPQTVSLIWPDAAGGNEEDILAHWCREGSGEGGVLLAGDLPAGLAAGLAAACRRAGRPGLMPSGDGMIRLFILGGQSSYRDCRAALDQRLGQVENYGAVAILGVGTAPGATRLHAEMLAYNPAVREVYAAGSLRMVGAAAYCAAGISSAERTRPIRPSSFLIG